jgi:hypothetical protein
MARSIKPRSTLLKTLNQMPRRLALTLNLTNSDRERGKRFHFLIFSSNLLDPTLNQIAPLNV